MAFSRYVRTPILDLGRQYGTSDTHEIIRKAIAAGSLPYKEMTLRENQRLDHIAASVYGNGRYAWIIAAASNIGWMLQVPAGTFLKIPDIDVVASLVA